ncbi:hypothetical protein [Asticcacaulis sp. EMRT-3]|uniref:DUF883 family protein n=1 Tax=Asticcacaulis sp. EMRT-3 TaxID=3040349 RepID=UPI0024AED62F|nr:hypothetical protein [Asticcacaulis sp. EMRT-3]MDI7776151.1 hypothetical protein [Asticcacaulis sp. EMRT-3]
MLSSATKAAANVTRKLAENDVRHSARDVLDDAIDAVDEKRHEMLDHVSEYANEAGQKVRGMYDKTRNTTNRVSHNVESEIKTNPVRSTLIALGIGFALGAIFTRR